MTEYYQVDVGDVPRENEKFVRAIRVIGKTSLKSAQEIADFLRDRRGGTIVAGIPLDVAEHIAQELVRVGAVTSIVPTSVKSPLSCNPRATYKFSWNKFRFLVAA